MTNIKNYRDASTYYHLREGLNKARNKTEINFAFWILAAIQLPIVLMLIYLLLTDKRVDKKSDEVSLKVMTSIDEEESKVYVCFMLHI